MDEKRIKLMAYMTTKYKGRSNGIYEVKIKGYGHKYLPLIPLKEKAGVTRVSQTKKLENWLNSDEGYEWAISVPEAEIMLC